MLKVLVQNQHGFWCLQDTGKKGIILKILECRAQMLPPLLKDRHEKEESILGNPNGGVILLESAELLLLCSRFFHDA